jgi:hypothetical protein
MDAHPPRRDDVNDLEARLGSWRPDADGLGADAMLFAAGQAAARRACPGPLWPALCGLLAVLAGGLGVWGMAEHSQREALTEMLNRRLPAARQPAHVVPDEPAPAYVPAPDAYLSLRRMLDQDQARWPGPSGPAEAQVSAPPPQPRVLQAGHRASWPDQ